MNNLQIYRKRIIPPECILLKDDTIIEANDEMIITKWQTLRPKDEFNHGSSVYFLKHGVKVSKFYRPDGELLYHYCDIVDYEFSEDHSKLIVTDLLADVIIYPGGRIKVMDLDELADASEHDLITPSQTALALRQLNDLLTIIDRDKFDKLQAPLDKYDL